MKQRIAKQTYMAQRNSRTQTKVNVLFLRDNKAKSSDSVNYEQWAIAEQLMTTESNTDNEEDQLRMEKEREIELKRQNEMRKAQKEKIDQEKALLLEKQIKELRNKNFTYDSQGNIIVINTPKLDQKNNPFRTVKHRVIQEQVINDQIQVKKRAQSERQQMYQNIFNNSKHEWVKNQQQQRQPLYDILQPSKGVVLKEGNKVKGSIDQNSNKTMSRRQYLELTQQSTKNNQDKFQQTPAQKHVKVLSGEEIYNSIPDFEIYGVTLPEIKTTKQAYSKKNKTFNIENTDWLNQKSIIDSFNQQIINKNNWGKNKFSNNPKIPHQLPKRPNLKEQWATHGSRSRKPDKPFIQIEDILNESKWNRPRDRPYISRKTQQSPSSLPKFSV